MTDSTRAARPKLSLTRAHSTDTASTPAPSGNAMDQRPRRHENENAAYAARAAACENGDGQGHAIADLLDPVCSHFNLGDESAADLAAFTRKLLGGSRLRSQRA